MICRNIRHEIGKRGNRQIDIIFICMNRDPVSAEIKELRAKVDLLSLQQEENLGAVNDLSEDVREDINNLYQAIAELSARIEEKKKEPRTKIGFKQNTDD